MVDEQGQTGGVPRFGASQRKRERALWPRPKRRKAIGAGRWRKRICIETDRLAGIAPRSSGMKVIWLG